MYLLRTLRKGKPGRKTARRSCLVFNCVERYHMATLIKEVFAANAGLEYIVRTSQLTAVLNFKTVRTVSFASRYPNSI